MSKEKAFSFIKGYSFSFEDEGRKIEAWFSTFSGLEKVYVDGELVSSQRNFAKESSNTFVIGADEYATRLKMVSLLKGPFECTLSKNGNALRRQKMVFPKRTSGAERFPFFVQLAFFIALGGVFGFAKAYWQLPEVSMYVFLGILFVLIVVLQGKGYMGSRPVFEDDDLT
ncbi:hypothetical protein [Marinimicrobium alkaliphilum]|uniref:hypothetical protein n=1 Tax=Marinimicrobium alkaliphilum TaxID=2202654 RepID=UPI000DB964B9|nr:hypothetical protein [Marinimicrobium alkaliphilum]